MNASKFTDKQIMDLSRSKTSYSNDDFIDLMNPTPANDDDCNTEDNASDSAAVTKKEGILPNYDFQPIRPAGFASRLSDSPPMGGGNGGSGSLNAWNSADLKPNSSAARSYGYTGSIEPEKLVLEKAHSVSDAAILSEIDSTMKRHTDNILHAIDGLSAHLSQLESRTRKLEYSVDDLKASIGNNHGGTDGKMRQLENILRELQSSVVELKDKQDVMNAQIKLEKLQTSEAAAQTPETHSSAPPQQTAPAPQQFPVPSQQPPLPPQQNISPPTPMQQLPPSQYPPTSMPGVPQQDTYYPPAGQTQQPPPSQQYPSPPPPQLQQPQPPPPVQPFQYNPGPPTPYPHGPQQYQQQQQPTINNPQPPQLQLPMGHLPEEPHLPSQSYPPSLRQPTSGPPPPPPQQFYNTMYDSPTPTGRSGSGFSSSEPLPPYSGSSSHYSNNPGTKYPSLSSGSNYPQLPTARVLPQAAAPVSSGASSGGGSGNRVPIDDVIDKVTNMGFSREQVKGTVRKLTENGQPVDLNIVLDKLMNDGGVQQPRGWFGR